MNLKEFTPLVFKYNGFKVKTSWLVIVVGPFLLIVDDCFRDFWINACYLLANSIFKLGRSLGIILIQSLLQVTPEIKVEVWKIRWRASHSTFQTGKPVFPQVDREEVTCSLPIQWFTFLVVLSGLWVELYHGYQHLSKNSPFSGF